MATSSIRNGILYIDSTPKILMWAISLFLNNFVLLHVLRSDWNHFHSGMSFETWYLFALYSVADLLYNELKGKKWRVSNVLYSHLAYLFGIFGVFKNIIKIKLNIIKCGS